MNFFSRMWGRILPRKSTPITRETTSVSTTPIKNTTLLKKQSNVIESIDDSAMSLNSPPYTSTMHPRFDDTLAAPFSHDPTKASLDLYSRHASLDRDIESHFSDKPEIVLRKSRDAEWQGHIKSAFTKAAFNRVSVEKIFEFAEQMAYGAAAGAEDLEEEKEKAYEDTTETVLLTEVYNSEEPVSSEIIASETEENSQQYTSEEWYRNGRSMALAHKHLTAIQYYENALKEVVKEQAIKVQEVNGHEVKTKKAKAQETKEQEEAEQKVKAKYLYKIALSYFFLQDMDQAALYCKKSFEEYKKYAIAYNTLAGIYRNHSRLQQDEPTIAKAYLELAMQNLKLAEKYSNPKARSANLLEKILIFMEKGDIKAANKSLNKVKKELRKQQDLSPSTEKMKKAEENLPAKISLIDNISSCTKKMAYIKKQSVKHNSLSNTTGDAKFLPQETDSVREALEKLKLSPEQTLLAGLVEEMTKLKSRLETFEEQSKNYVTSDQVSVAIANNPGEELAAKQMKEINSIPQLKEYFEAFIRTIHSAYAAALAISTGRVATDTSNIGVDVAAKLLSFIPVWGSSIEGAVKQIVNFYQDKDIKFSGECLLTIAYSPLNLDGRIAPAARLATLDLTKRAQILSKTTPAPSNWFTKILTKVVEPAYDKLKPANNQHDTLATRLGNKDAYIVIVKWIEYQKHAKKTQSVATMTDEDVTAFILKTLTEFANVEIEPQMLYPIQEERLFFKLCQGHIYLPNFSLSGK